MDRQSGMSIFFIFKKKILFKQRLEETAGKLVAARKIIVQGYKNCPKSQDVWLEAARLHDLEESKNILSHASRQIPQSVPIWLAAANLERYQTKLHHKMNIFSIRLHSFLTIQLKFLIIINYD